MGRGLRLRTELILGCNVNGLMGGLNVQFGNFILCRLLHQRGSDLRDHDQFMLGPVMLICSLCWLHSLKSCQTNVLN